MAKVFLALLLILQDFPSVDMGYQGGFEVYWYTSNKTNCVLKVVHIRYFSNGWGIPNPSPLAFHSTELAYTFCDFEIPLRPIKKYKDINLSIWCQDIFHPHHFELVGKSKSTSASFYSEARKIARVHFAQNKTLWKIYSSYHIKFYFHLRQIKTAELLKGAVQKFGDKNLYLQWFQSHVRESSISMAS